MAAPSRYETLIQTRLRQQRRKLAVASPLRFAQIYLAACCTKPFSNMHKDLFADLLQIIQERSARLSYAAPRGHAKSTIVSLAFVLWCLLYGKEKLILLVSATREQVVLLLGHIKDQLERNELLRSDFPELCRIEGGPGSGRQPKPWRDNRIRLTNGAMVCAYGAGQGLRGARNDKHRPGLIIVDDLEDQEHVIYEEQRDKLRAWFERTLLHAGHTETNVVVVGTVLHHDSLLANLVNPKESRGWTSRRYRAVLSFSDRPDHWDTWSAVFAGRQDFDGRTGPVAARIFFEINSEAMLQGTSVLWPDWESYYDLMVMREREGRGSFQAEKQNEPFDPQQCIFSEASLHYWDDEYANEQALLDALGSDGYFYGACDPSLGKRTGRGDFTAIIVLYQPRKTKINYVIAADIARRPPDQTIERIIQYAGMYRFNKFGVEVNQFQSLMVDNLERRAREACVRLPIARIESRSNKQARISSLEPEVAQGRIQFNRRDQLLLEQLQAFPLGSHDDGPDALEMAVDTARRPRHRLVSTCLLTGETLFDSEWAH